MTLNNRIQRSSQNSFNFLLVTIVAVSMTSLLVSSADSFAAKAKTLAPIKTPAVASGVTKPSGGAHWIFDMDHSTAGGVEFKAVGKPSGLRVVGKGDAPKGQFVVADKSVTGSASFKLETLNTGINMRDEHMKKKYLETEKFPDAKLTLTKLDLPQDLLAKDGLAQQIPFEGTLTLHGVEKPVKGTAQVDHKGESASILAQFETKISDYGISIPSFAGITIADRVTVDVTSSAPLKKQ